MTTAIIPYTAYYSHLPVSMGTLCLQYSLNEYIKLRRGFVESMSGTIKVISSLHSGMASILEHTHSQSVRGMIKFQ